MTELTSTAHTVLTATAPFDLACSLRAIKGFTPSSGDQVIADGRVRKAFRHPTDPARAVVAEVVGRDDGVPGVGLTVFSDESLGPFEVAAVAGWVAQWLSLGDDRSEFLAVARADPAMGRVLAVAGGLHQVRFASLAEGATFFTLTQRSTQWFATARKRRLVDDHGPRCVLDHKVLTAFPDLSLLTSMAPDHLLPYAGSRARAERLTTVLAGIAELDEQWLRTGPYEEARAALLAVRGIGTFTAHALLPRVLGRPDAVPLELAQFRKVALDLYGEPTPTPAELRSRYGPWIGWWAYTSRTALSWLDQDEKALQRSLARAAA
ncbi:hypothetical protein Drose_03405 [Dactylosporangium roseum]|uniref:DNA-3-methyladenine glycosylase II n=1 Tax=Dactylosporangium roseum TaxID=47989 RepID=A0ABY5Z5P9_9ACTN|nr:hypothetical protein [Dactylosporangium roseum]UWZ37346.1 hypothetical protein Drose_03405 [Dactylosporangium roseum]